MSFELCITYCRFKMSMAGDILHIVPCFISLYLVFPPSPPPCVPPSPPSNAGSGAILCSSSQERSGRVKTASIFLALFSKIKPLRKQRRHWVQREYLEKY